MKPRSATLIVIVVAMALATASVLAVALAGGAFGHGRRWWSGTSCTVPQLPGTVVGATLQNMGGPMMGGGGRPMSGGMMRLTLDRNTVAAGQVSFVASNIGSINHELVVLSLPDNQIVGTRAVGADAKTSEAGSVAEASATCNEGAGDGIAPGGSSWVTVNLPAGRYEVICNLPGHYAAGMYAQLVVN